MNGQDRIPYCLILLQFASRGIGCGAQRTKLHGMWGWNADASAQQQFFQQSQDHFDDANPNMWMQAYYVNDNFWAGASSKAPVFLYIGGEGALSAGSATSNFITDLLPWTKSLLFAVEHRYYGCVRNSSSCPYGGASKQTSGSSGHLRFLSSRQALADLARFQRVMSAVYQMDDDTKWVAVGGSYPGMLAAFARAVYPSSFHAAIASSAPVNGQLDMEAFENVVSSAYALDVEGVRGSPKCRDAIANGHHSIGALLGSAEGRQELAEKFPSAVASADWLEDPTNQRTFAGCGVASFPAQANEPSCSSPGCGISQICHIMMNESIGTPLLRLAALRAVQDATHPNMVSDCEMDWEMPGDVPMTLEENTVSAYWGYQTCTEFGFYQTCAVGSDCFFTQGLVSFESADHKPSSFCSDVFGISEEETLAAIEQTNDYYRSKVSNATRIIWVNGNVDPWHGRSHLSPPGEDQPVIWPVEGAAHCAWMGAASPQDQSSVAEARQQIFAYLGGWLSEIGERSTADTITV